MTQQLLIHQAEIDSIEVTEEMVKVELDQRIQYFSAQVGGTKHWKSFMENQLKKLKRNFLNK